MVHSAQKRVLIPLLLAVVVVLKVVFVLMALWLMIMEDVEVLVLVSDYPKQKHLGCKKPMPIKSSSFLTVATYVAILVTKSFDIS